MQEKLIYILNKLKHKPTIIDCGDKIALYWNTKRYYIDIEIYKNYIDICISEDRKHLEMFRFHD